jgi:mono/diheme cytochrome c family protein
MRFSWLTALLGCAAVFSAPSRAVESSSAIDYNRQIRPILAENCFTCHGPDSAARKASLRLDRFDDAIATRKDSKPAIIPGKPEESEAIRRIFTSDEEDRMPPAKSKKTLKPEEKEALKKWVASGAKYAAHWSLIAPQKVNVPDIKDKSWLRTPIDAFIGARLDSEALAAAPEADKRTLARRVSLDLTGLPPSPELVQSFMDDSSENAYERLVDKLLASQHYGEHRARFWLDAARYADSNGIHFDNYREIWAYRDWVINAFNKNLPFSQFTIDQLAGDLLPNPSLDQKIATGFNRCNITTSEGGAIDEEYRVFYTRDRTETTSAVWMGITANCAVCHDHKYDPLTQREFYQMSAYFNNTTQPAMDGNLKDTAPTVVVPTSQDRERWEGLPPLKKAAKERVDLRRQGALDDYQSWLAKATPDQILQGMPTEGLQFSAPLKEPAVQSISVFINGYPRTIPLAPVQEGVISEQAFTTAKEHTPVIPEAGDFERDQSFSVAFWVKLSPDDKQGSILSRMDEDDNFRGWDVWIEEGKVGMHLVSKWPEDALKGISKKRIEMNKWAHLVVSYNGSSKAEGVSVYINGEPQETDRPNDKLQNSIRSKAPFKIGQRKKAEFLEKAGVQDLRIYNRVLSEDEVGALQSKPRLSWLVSKPAERRNEEEQKILFDGYLNAYDTHYMAASKAMAGLEKEERDIKKRGTIAHIMNEKPEPALAYVLFRGEYDKRRDKVEPATPKMFPSMPADYPSNRLGFAKWLLSPDHPLTARVAVNRLWQEIFGTGIVRTSGDFGVSGELPSNQELLDWLAVDFRESGWDVKRLVKMMVMSSAYRQSSVATPEKLGKDPQNRLLSRGPRFRLDGESIRDYALSASGLLCEKIGGPSVKPYQPGGVWEMVAMPESNTHDYKQDSGDKLYRRSLYTFWKRTAPPATMDIFNAPTRETCTVRRERTNTPLQALATLNDPQFVEAARHLAELSLEHGGDTMDSRLDYIALRLLARPLRSEEKQVVCKSLSDLSEHYKAAPDEAKKLVMIGEAKPSDKLESPLLAAYTMVVNELMNLDEVLNK